jgi:hypothetical protein
MNPNTIIRIRIAPDPEDLGNGGITSYKLENPTIIFTDTHMNICGEGIRLKVKREDVLYFEVFV